MSSYFALAHAGTPTEISLLCEHHGTMADGTVRFVVENGGWKGLLFPDKTVYVYDTKEKFPAVVLWVGPWPKACPSYNEAMAAVARMIAAGNVLTDLALVLPETCCAHCRWFDRPEWYSSDDDEDSLGDCRWPADRLPHSLRYGNRERLGVGPRDGVDCSCFERAPDTSESDTSEPADVPF